MVRSRRGFTLVELLVVIAIIALLMAILMPVLSRAKEQARIMTCRSNLRQYGMAMAMYLDDNKDTFPTTHTYLFTSQPGSCQWHNAAEWLNVDGPMWPYLKDKKAHLCPSFNSIAGQRGRFHPGHDPSIPVEPQYGYSMNAHLGKPIGPGEAATGRFRKLTQIRHPAEVFLFSEENMWALEGLVNAPAVLNDTNLWIGSPTDRVYDFFATFHSPPKGDMDKGGVNMVFIDAHVEYVNLMEGTLEEAVEKAWELAWPR